MTYRNVFIVHGTRQNELIHLLYQSLIRIYDGKVPVTSGRTYDALFGTRHW